MSEYRTIVGTMECDYFCQLPPKRILERCLDVTLTDLHRDGCGLAELKAVFDAVWMISHMRIEQSVPIVPDDELTFRTYPRVEGLGCYYLDADILRGGSIIAKFECSYIAVARVERHILRLSQLEPLWKTPPRAAVSAPLQRLRPECEFFPCGSDEVRLSDCDKNHHMTSGAYLSLVCDAAGYWESDAPRLMRSVQVDFSSEVHPGTTLRFLRGEADGFRYVRGVKPDDRIAFTAACAF